MTIRIKDLICPKCGCEVEEDDVLDIDHEGASIICFVVGHCTNCNTNYQWNEHYETIGTTALEES